ncbi:MAG: fructosamine kinase, partial [Rhodospirillales bacterium]|nr:fructosamine kinase [Rhodospirillales bacterium]
MSLPRARVAGALGSAVTAANALSGGSIAAVWRVRLADGRDAVVKSGRGLDLEAWMLRWLERETAAPVPKVLHAEEDLLVLEW